MNKESQTEAYVFAPGDIDLQLARLLESHHFCHSHRYPALLKHLVEQVQMGNTAGLKERLLGIEVFHRPPGYDTSSDPIVRVTAGEVRKRIAQYYHEPEHRAELRIELPVGSYVPRFFPARVRDEVPAAERAASRPTSVAQTDDDLAPGQAGYVNTPDTGTSHRGEPTAGPQVPKSPAHGPASSRLLDEPSTLAFSTESVAAVSRPGEPVASWRKQNILLLGLALLLGASLASATSAVQTWRIARQTRALHQLWAPLNTGEVPPLFVVGDHSLDDHGRSLGMTPVASSGVDTVLTQMNRRSQVPFDDTVSLDKIHALFNRDNRPYQDKGAGEATLEDLRKGPVVLFAGFDNRWTVHLSQQLRFRLVPNLDDNLASIVDTKDPNHRWTVNFAEPVNELVSDYGIVARYFDPLLEQNVMLVAGVGSMGTAAASEFVTQERFAREIDHAAPAGWKTGNFEIVLNAPVVDGHPGPPRIVASAYW